MTTKRKPILQKLCKFIRYSVLPADSINQFTVHAYIVYIQCNASYVPCMGKNRNCAYAEIV